MASNFFLNNNGFDEDDRIDFTDLYSNIEQQNEKKKTILVSHNDFIDAFKDEYMDKKNKRDSNNILLFDNIDELIKESNDKDKLIEVLDSL